MAWPTPKNVTEVISFMGLVGYYRRFIRDFSKIGHPIITLQRKRLRFQFTPECANNFEQLKYLHTHAPILRIVDWEKYFLVCTDACKEGLGRVLMQEEHVIFYASRKLNENERNCHQWPITCNNYSCIKNVDTLSDRAEVCINVRPCGIEIFIQSTQIESKTGHMAASHQQIWLQYELPQGEGEQSGWCT